MPGARYTKSFNTLTSAFQAEAADRPEEERVVQWICGDDEEAKRLALDLAGRLVLGRALDAGPLANARGLEGMTAVILNLNRRYGGAASIRITGLRIP
jgi:predicted dinucleotide-binding enzyme